MKILLCTTPIRPVPTSYPPFGTMAIMQALRKAGHNPHFYDIDGLRPSFEDVEAFFRDYQPDIVGISAVVSTAYAYTKRLAAMIRRVCPNAKIVLGGNMAASAEILHRLAGIDICVIGEGERIIVNLAEALQESNFRLSDSILSGVPGITYLKPDGELCFTGYETRLPADQVFDPDFSILESYSKMENYLKDPCLYPDFLQDSRVKEPHRRGKTMATLVTSKGCVARCTFCHRWDKGYRSIPVEQIIAKSRMLMERYNVGFIAFGDENFGSDRRQAEQFIDAIKPLDILWCVGGVRVRSVDPALLRRMKEAGCVAVYYGMETGSETILKIMEKKASVQDNLNAALWTKEAGLFTIYQMVLAMPGETEQTIAETIDFLKKLTQDHFESPRSKISLNYIQALPGTPVYEFARARGLIGRSLLDEERYLISISDTNADDDTRMLNFTDEDYLTVRSWRRRIVLQVMRHYHEHNKTPIPGPFTVLQRLFVKKLFTRRTHTDAAVAQEVTVAEYDKGGYFNLARDLGYDVIVAYFYPLRNIILAAWLLQDEFRRIPLRDLLTHVGQWLGRRLGLGAARSIPALSLRETMLSLAAPAKSGTERAMQPLRLGR